MAPGPSKAMHVPPAPGPSHHAAEKSGELPSARDWEPIRAGSLRDSSQRDCVLVWNWSTPRLLSIKRSSTLLCPVGCLLLLTIIVI